jgi:hypothetical protein
MTKPNTKNVELGQIPSSCASVKPVTFSASAALN